MSDPDNPILDPSLSEEEKEKEAIRIYFDLYRKGDFYECHDVMEEIWFETFGKKRLFFQGLLQCAVARFHFGNDNLHGAQVLYREGTRKLEPFRPEFLGVDLEAYLGEIKQVLPRIVHSPRDGEWF